MAVSANTVTYSGSGPKHDLVWNVKRK